MGMSLSSYVKGIKPPDAKWRKMKAAYDACVAAGAPVPDVVDDFFDGETPDDAGVVVDLEDCVAVKRYSVDRCDCFEVDVTKLPRDVTTIRFVNSYD